MNDLPTETVTILSPTSRDHGAPAELGPACQAVQDDDDGQLQILVS
jgi:hypothetical protein